MFLVASIIGEVEWALKQINGIGISKKDSFETHKAKNGAIYRKSPYIHSYDYYKKIQAESINFVKWAKKEHGIKSIYQLESKHHKQYIEKKQAEGVSPGQLVNIESYLLKMQKGMSKVSGIREKEATTFIEGRTIKNNKKPHNRAYKASEIAKLGENMSAKVSLASGLSVHLGFRAKEAAKIRTEHIKLHENNKVSVAIPEGRGVTKAGRYRYINKKEVPQSFHKDLKNVLQQKEKGQKIVGVKTSTLRKGLNRASKATGITSKGWHGFRHTFSRNRLDELFEATGKAADCRDALKHISNNRQAGKPVHADFSDENEKEVFKMVKNFIDQVHDEMGHGEDRWALADVYILSSS